MKRHILAILIAAIMVMSPVMAFAGSEASAQDDAAQTETVQTEGEDAQGEADQAEGVDQAEDGAGQTDTDQAEGVDQAEDSSDQTGTDQDGDGEDQSGTDQDGDGEEQPEDPAPQPGWNEDRTMYYLEDGTAATGLFRAETEKGTMALYYANKAGVVKTTAGWVYQDGKKYRVTTSGTVRTKEGAFYVGDYRYVIPTGAVNGAVCRTVGPVKSNGYLYYVRNKNGVLGVHKAYTLNKKTYHVNSKGVITIGKHKWKDGKYYYSFKSGHIKTKAGMIVIGTKRFLVVKGGHVAVSQKFKWNNNYYIACSNGNVYTGLFKWKKVLYYASSKGVLKAKSGIVTVDGSQYFVNKGGKVSVSKMISFDGKKYVSDSNGKLRTGVFKYSGVYYLAEADHSICTTKKVFKYSGKYYFNKKSGRLARNEFVEFEGKFYYAGDTAAFLTETFNMKGVTFNPAKNGELPEEEYRKLYPVDDDEDDY